MAANNPSEKTATDEVDVTSISSILDVLLGVFSAFSTPLNPLPTPVVMVGKRLRPGMSARNLTARIVEALEKDAGLPMGDVFSDGPNREAKKIKTIAEKIVSMIQTEALVDVAIDTGAIQISSTGSCPVGPVIAQGSNLLPVGGGGGIR